MKTIFLLLVWVFSLLVCTCLLLLHAGEPAAAQVLILKNERTLEGEVERVGDRYRIRRSVGETLLPADRVLKVCASRQEAYEFFRSRANLRDPDERLKLARWCHLHGLRDQAQTEAAAAVDLQPDHPEAKRLLQHLRQNAAAPAEPAAPPESAPADVGPLAAVEVNADALAQFSTRVQPILMNACARCHATNQGGAFKLTRAYDAPGVDRKTMQRNLTAVLGQINLERPQGSPLLAKAVSAHGSLTEAPLRGRKAAAFRTLEDWVQATVSGNPHLRLATEKSPATAVVTPRPQTETVTAAPTTPSAPMKPVPVEPAAAAAPADAAPVDEFDPLPFNRQMHPGKKPSSPSPAAAPATGPPG